MPGCPIALLQEKEPRDLLHAKVEEIHGFVRQQFYDEDCRREEREAKRAEEEREAGAKRAEEEREAGERGAMRGADLESEWKQYRFGNHTCRMRRRPGDGRWQVLVPRKAYRRIKKTLGRHSAASRRVWETVVQLDWGFCEEAGRVFLRTTGHEGMDLSSIPLPPRTPKS